MSTNVFRFWVLSHFVSSSGVVKRWITLWFNLASTRHLAGRKGRNHVSNSGKDKRFYSGAHQWSYIMAAEDCFPRHKSGLKLTSNLQLQWKLRMNGALPLLPLMRSWRPLGWFYLWTKEDRRGRMTSFTKLERLRKAAINCIIIIIITYLLTYLLASLLAYLLTYVLTYLLTYCNWVVTRWQ